MDSVKVRQRVGADGMLHLHIPIGLADRDVDVMIVYQSAQPGKPGQSSLESLYGICADDPIVLDSGGVAETLDDELAGAFD
jgi:hypothetical protein